MRITNYSCLSYLGVCNERALNLSSTKIMSWYNNYIVYSPSNPVITILISSASVTRKIITFKITEIGFDERLRNINWENYCNDLPFNPSALSLYKWAPIAEELKTLDRKIVLNSVILKWDVVKKEFKERIKF